MGAAETLRKLKSWSYSKWSMFNQCKYKFKEVHLKGNYGPAGPAADRGNAIHKVAEQFILNNITGMPKEIACFDREFKELRRRVKKGIGFGEQEWAHDKDWRPTAWKGPKTWVRGKCDYHGVDETEDGVVIDIVDYKTGRMYSSHEKQAKLYGVMGMHRYQDVVGAHVEFWYLDQDEITEFDFSLGDLKKLNTFWTNQGRKMMEAKAFPKEPGDHCRYCHLRDNKLGTCKAWRKL